MYVVQQIALRGNENCIIKWKVVSLSQEPQLQKSMRFSIFVTGVCRSNLISVNDGKSFQITMAVIKVGMFFFRNFFVQFIPVLVI